MTAKIFKPIVLEVLGLSIEDINLKSTHSISSKKFKCAMYTLLKKYTVMSNRKILLEMGYEIDKNKQFNYSNTIYIIQKNYLNFMDDDRLFRLSMLEMQLKIKELLDTKEKELTK